MTRDNPHFHWREGEVRDWGPAWRPFLSPLRLACLTPVALVLWVGYQFFQPIAIPPFAGATLLVYNERGRVERTLEVEGLLDKSAVQIVTTSGEVFEAAQPNTVLILTDGRILDYRTKRRPE